VARHLVDEGPYHDDIVQSVQVEPIAYSGDTKNFNWVIHRADVKVIGSSALTNCYSYRMLNNFGPSLTFTKKICKHKQYCQSLGPTFSNTPYVTSPNNLDNLLLAYCKRLCPPMPVPNDSIMGRFSGFVSDFLQTNLKPLPFEQDLKLAFDEWLQGCGNYTLARKLQLQRSFETLSERGFSLLESDYSIKSFIKKEYYSEPKNIRFINSRTDLFKVRVASFIKLIETQFFNIDYFIKYTDIRMSWSKLKALLKYKYFVKTDYTSFESGFSPEYTDITECALFRYMLSNNPLILKDVLRCYYQKKGNLIIPRNERIKHAGFQYRCRVTGTRMSGEMWTSLANSFSNLMNMLFLCKERNINVDGLVEGDDGIFGLDDNTLQTQDFQQLGFKIKLQYETDLHGINFCGLYYNKFDNLNILGPQNLIRFGWSLHPNYFNCGRPKQLELLLSKAMSLYCLGKYTPIASALSLRVINFIKQNFPKCTPSVVHRTDWWYYNTYLKFIESEINFLPITVLDSSRDLFFSLFGIDPKEQLRIEEEINTCDDILTHVFKFGFGNFNFSNLRDC
jgi:hypothetical protein